MTRCDLVLTIPPCADGPLQNAAALHGNVAVIERGGVPFTDKAMVATKAGAVAVIFINHVPGHEMIVPMAAPVEDGPHASGLQLRNDCEAEAETGETPLRIPAACISEQDGRRLREMLKAAEAGTSSVSVRWTVLAAEWAARRIQNSWRRRRATAVDEANGAMHAG